MNRDIPPATLVPIVELIVAGQKIEAIKLYRESHATSLADAKKFIERLTAELEDEYPEGFPSPAAGGCAGTLTVVAATIAAASYAVTISGMLT